MSLSEELIWRGFNGYTTLKDLTELDSKTFNFYIGVDPSSDSMTIGNLASAMMVRHFMNYGHKAHLLVGGATGLIGDPDGKASERDILSTIEVENNKINIKAQYERLFAGQNYQIVDNFDWFKDMKYLDFLRDIGKFVPLSSMLARDFVKARLGNNGSGISYAEFSYSLIQGYDFLHLYKNFGVDLQLCGVDQTGNVLAGIDLIRKKESAEAHLFAMPLMINKLTGIKFGKTESGAIWLDENKTSVYKFYQFWLNDDDANVIDHLKIYTLLDRKSIESIENQHKSDPGRRIAQKTLAMQVTKIVHGEVRANSAEKVSEVLFGHNEFGNLTNEDIEMLSREIPCSNVGSNVIDILVKTSIVESNGAGKRLLDAGALSVNGQKISDNVLLEKPCLIKKGKNSFVLVK